MSWATKIDKKNLKIIIKFKDLEDLEYFREYILHD